MTPYYDHAGITIYHGDCLEILPTLAPVDLVLTDPPYNAINRDTGGLRQIDKGAADSTPIDIPWLAAEFMRLATGSIYVWCSGEQYTLWLQEFRNAGLTTRNCAWWKTNPSPMNGDALWLSAMELCVFARKAKAKFNRFCAAPVWRGPIAEANGHPTPKPEWLMRELILASSADGETVLDPFMGSGTTLKCAKELGRQAIGIELNESYAELAARRLEQEMLDLGPVTPCTDAECAQLGLQDEFDDALIEQGALYA